MGNLELSTEHLASIQCQLPVNGLTHGFYKYPARFAPQLARALIERFTEPGDLVLDPFCGGGTSLVEAAALGRRAIGLDISPLAVFLTRVKTYPLGDDGRKELQAWAEASSHLTLRTPLPQPALLWRELGYHKHLTGRQTWPIRKNIELLLSQIDHFSRSRLKEFARCAVLRAGQWALDGRKDIPTAKQFRMKFCSLVKEMLDGMSEYEIACKRANASWSNPVCLVQSANKLHLEKSLEDYWPPKLILTSPPYPGVHVLYHRWQISGSRETPAPFWIADKLDGKGASHYTMGGRNSNDNGLYFDSLADCFKSIRKISDENSVVAQVVGFSDPNSQFGQYINTLSGCGFQETMVTARSRLRPFRVWRKVPGRRWYTNKNTKLHSNKEVVLLHRPCSGDIPGAILSVRHQIPGHQASE